MRAIESLPDLGTAFRRFVAEDSAAPVLWFERGGTAPQGLTREDLRHGAEAFARSYREAGAVPGDRVAIVLRTSPEFFFAFWACQLAGLIPVPAYPPFPGRRLAGGLERLRGVLSKARPAVWAADPVLVETLRSEGWDDLPPNCQGWDGDPGWRAQDNVVLGPEDPALVQFTSGSTLSPRGCCLSQRAVLANVLAGCETMAFREDDLAVSWLPLYHDMGLIGSVLVPIVGGRLRCVFLGPEEFILDPMLWLRTSARHRASILAAPNFAFSLVVRRLRGHAPDIDLHGVRAIVNGAEPIDPQVVRDFLEVLEPCGLSPAAMWPSWGLAENTVLATMSPGGMRLDRVDRQRVECEGLAVPASTGREEAEIVCLGKPIRGADLRVVDEDGGTLPERCVGDIELRSTSLMDGYFEEPEATAAAFRDGWLRTGDVGYLAADELYIVGRRKDLVIVGGRNVAPQDVERVVDRLAGVRRGCTVAFGVPGEAGTEELVVVVEVRGVVDGLRGHVARACRDTLDVIPGEVAVAEAGQIPKTSSGKLQRHHARTLFLNGAFRVIAPGR